VIADIGTVMWKELKELLLRRGSFLSGGFSNAIMSLTVFGILLPLQFRSTWLDSIWTVFWIAFVTSFWTIGYVADTFAGERERHTLETLLASRLSDASILLGKLGAVVAYVWGQVLASLLLGAVTVNILQWQGQFRFYSASVALGTMGLSLLGAGLIASLGILTSLHAPTARQAQQRLLIPVTLLLLLPSLASIILPADQQERLLTALATANLTVVVLAALGCLLLADSALITIALARFQRTRLVTD
jgi:ABC-2 type transport system permease protein